MADTKHRRTIGICAFVALVIVIGFCAPEAYSVYKRKIMVERVMTADKGTITFGPHLNGNQHSISWLGMILGDQLVEAIELPAKTSLDERRSIRMVLREAFIYQKARVGETIRDFPDDRNPSEWR